MDLSSSPRAIAVSKARPVVAIATDNAVLIFESDSVENYMTITPASARSVAFSTDGKYMAFGTSAGILSLFSCDNFGAITSVECHESDVRALSFSPESTRLVTGSDDQVIFVLSVPSLSIVNKLSSQSKIVRCIVFVNNVNFITCGDSSIRFWDCNSGKCLFAVKEHTGKVLSVAISPNGEYIASGGSDKTLKIFRMADRVCVKTVDFANYVQRVAFVDDATIIAGIYQSDMVSVDLDSGLIVRKFGKYLEPNGIVAIQRPSAVASRPKSETKAVSVKDTPAATPPVTSYSMSDMSLSSPITEFLEYLQLSEVRHVS